MDSSDLFSRLMFGFGDTTVGRMNRRGIAQRSTNDRQNQEKAGRCRASLNRARASRQMRARQRSLSAR